MIDSRKTMRLIYGTTTKDVRMLRHSLNALGAILQCTSRKIIGTDLRDSERCNGSTEFFGMELHYKIRSCAIGRVHLTSSSFPSDQAASYTMEYSAFDKNTPTLPTPVSVQSADALPSQTTQCPLNKAAVLINQILLTAYPYPTSLQGLAWLWKIIIGPLCSLGGGTCGTVFECNGRNKIGGYGKHSQRSPPTKSSEMNSSRTERSTGLSSLLSKQALTRLAQ